MFHRFLEGYIRHPLYTIPRLNVNNASPEALRCKGLKHFLGTFNQLRFFKIIIHSKSLSRSLAPLAHTIFQKFQQIGLYIPLYLVPLMSQTLTTRTAVDVKQTRRK